MTHQKEQSQPRLCFPSPTLSYCFVTEEGQVALRLWGWKENVSPLLMFMCQISMRWHGNHQYSIFDCLFTRGSCQYKASCNKNHCSVQISSDLSRSHVFLLLKIGSVRLISSEIISAPTMAYTNCYHCFSNLTV